MRVDALAIALRPRRMSEAADLGQRLVQVHARSLWHCYLPVWALVLVLALSTVEIAGWLPGLIVFWCKPWLDRTLLFVLSRAVFGDGTTPRDLWAARRHVLLGAPWRTWVTARLSPWRAFTQPIEQLEGQHGTARRRRRAVLLGSERGAASGLQIVYAHVEMFLLLALLSLAAWFLPDAMKTQLWQQWQGTTAPGLDAAFAALYATVVLALEPFYVAAGFAMYLNRRVELEAWDIEQEFRREF